MKRRSKTRLIAAEIAAIAVNIVPLGLWLFEDYPVSTVMVVYALESAAAIALAVLCVIIVSPSHDPGGSAKYKRKAKLIGDFLTISFGLLIGCGIFLTAFLFLVLKVEIDLRIVAIAFAIALGFQLIEFAANVLTLRPLPLRKAEYLLTLSMGSTALLFLGVFAGMFLAAFVNEWFVLPFVMLKTLADIGEPIQFFLGADEAEVPLEVEINSNRRTSV